MVAPHLEHNTYMGLYECLLHSRLTDGDGSSFWQSDGAARSHWVRLRLKSGVSSLKHLSTHIHHMQTTCISHGCLMSLYSSSSRLTDGDGSSFWQSDGAARSHWVRLRLKSGVSLKHLSIEVARQDQSYMPQHVIVSTGRSLSAMKDIRDIRVPK